MFTSENKVVKINATHSHTKTVLAELRFYESSTLNEVKESLSRKFGTLPEYMKLKLIKTSGEERPFSQYDEDKTLKDIDVQSFDTIHVIDFNPNSVLVQMNIDDVSTVKKYEISNEDYAKRENNVKKFRKQLKNDPNYKKVIEEKIPSFEAQAKEIEVGLRCLLGDGLRRGEVKYVGKCKEMGNGYWIGIALDEPYGDNNGSFGNKKYFECLENFGIFVRPSYVKTGDFPVLNEFNENEDEI